MKMPKLSGIGTQIRKALKILGFINMCIDIVEFVADAFDKFDNGGYGKDKSKSEADS